MSVRRRHQDSHQTNGTIETNGNAERDKKIHDARTDLTRWRMKDDRGTQTWHYLETDEEVKQWPMSAADRHYLGLDTVGRKLWLLQTSCYANV